MNTIMGVEAERGRQSPSNEICDWCGREECLDAKLCAERIKRDEESWAGVLE